MRPPRNTLVAILLAAVVIALAIPFVSQGPDEDPSAEQPQDHPLDPAAVFQGIRQEVAPDLKIEVPEEWNGPGWCYLTEAWLKCDRAQILRGDGWSARLEVSEELGWKKPNIHVPRPSHVVGVQVYFVDPDWLTSGDESEGLARILIFVVPPPARRP